MQVSARILGQDYGLTAEEMNRVLVKLGFLKGSPGDYSLTEKAMQYAVEKDFTEGQAGILVITAIGPREHLTIQSRKCWTYLPN